MASISELKTDGIGGPLQVRILRKWKHEVRQYETWYLAVDRFANAIQILRQRTNQSYIEFVLNVSECYNISDYCCPQLDKYQKFLEKDCTKASGEPFVLLIQTDESFVSGSELAINLWKECITNPHKFNRSCLHPPPVTTVVAATNLKPSISNGALCHGSSHATHIHVNPEIPETTSLINLTFKTSADIIRNTLDPIRHEGQKQI
ncbi:unnamed protein product [Lactuca saligna]|uniref:Uncharacterized protein n=1 Tax=Lactuca saligna TaxID=75948 RepID=A0AA36E6M4_LACSI|nr:unnamed protein product [Lactuca saligna]CAI9283346.1 unnamed protein product [Lactuca saligna]